MAKYTLTDILAELIYLHEQLNELAIKKVETVKKNEIMALNEIIKQETSLIKKLTKAEQSRMDVVQEFRRAKELVIEDVTMELIIEHSPVEEQPKLTEQFQILLNEMIRLKEMNELNKMLIEDSLRFVNLSLDLLSPDMTDMNYERPTNKEDELSAPRGRSIFDSRA